MRHCPTCNGTGLVYVGTGHRMSGYPWTEQHAQEACKDCGGKRTAPRPEPATPEQVQRAQDSFEAIADRLVARTLKRYQDDLERAAQ